MVVCPIVSWWSSLSTSCCLLLNRIVVPFLGGLESLRLHDSFKIYHLKRGILKKSDIIFERLHWLLLYAIEISVKNLLAGKLVIAVYQFLYLGKLDLTTRARLESMQTRKQNHSQSFCNSPSPVHILNVNGRKSAPFFSWCQAFAIRSVPPKC